MNNKNLNYFKLSLFTLCLFTQYSAAHPNHHVVEFADTTIVSSENNESIADIAQPVIILDQDDLHHNSGQTLGTLLEKTPGVSNASFGPGVGRPVIRGMHGSRIKIMQNGHDSADLSAMSCDHAPMADVATTKGVEVIQGPNTLRYGGGAIGGIVNVLDDKIHDTPLSGVDGYAESRLSSNGEGYGIAAGVNVGNEVFVMHVDGFHNNFNDYNQGKGQKTDALSNVSIQNSDTTGKGGSLGLTWTPEDNSYLGASISTLGYEYGVPNEKNEHARVRLKQIRYDIKSNWDTPFLGISSWKNQLSFTDYIHDEYTAPVIEGLFDKETWELSSTLTHEPISGWRGHIGVAWGLKDLKLCHNHSGCYGLPYHDQNNWDGSAGELLYNKKGFTFAHDTPMPNTQTQDFGLFLIEKKKWQQTTLELGARIDQRTISTDANAVNIDYRRKNSYYDDQSFTPVTLSAAGTWRLNDRHRIALSLARAERAPEAEEIYWNGDHHATFSYQLDNPDLKKETAYTADINWQYMQQRRFVRIALYHYLFSGYIYNDLKSMKDPYHANSVYKHEQRDAHFTGAEFTFQQQLNENFDLAFQADIVRAQLNNGKNKNLPRTPPASLLFRLNWNKGNWSASVEDHHRFRQDKVAANESISKAFNTVNARLSYYSTFYNSDALISLQLNNVLDSHGKNHVSYLKDFAPESGRNIKLNARLEF